MNMNFKIVLAKPKKITTSSPKKVSSTLLRGVVVLEGNTYMCHIKLDDSTNRVVPFTDKSFELYGRTNVFLREKGKHGYERFIRNEWKAKLNPGNPEKYIPFAPNWIVNGYLVRDNNKQLLFDFNDIITINGYDNQYIEL